MIYSIHAKFKNLSNRLRRFHGSILSYFRLFYLFTQFLRRHFFNLYRHFIRIYFYNFGQFMAYFPSINRQPKSPRKIQTSFEAAPFSVNHILPIPYPGTRLTYLKYSLLSTQPQAPHSATAMHSLIVSRSFNQRFTKPLQFNTELYFNSFNIHVIFN